MENNILNEQIINYEKELKENYIVFYSNLVASNINALYKYFGNSHDISFQQICNTSNDMFILSKRETEKLNNLIVETLKNQYNLKMIEQENIRIEKI